MSKKPGKRRWSLTLLYSTAFFLIQLAAVLITAALSFLLTKLGVLDNLGIPRNSGFAMLIVMLLISVLVGSVVAIGTVKIPLRPFNRLINNIDRLAAGDFTARMHYGKVMGDNPVFQELSESFNAMAEELENTQMLRSDFINNFSHEFKTPIVSIAGFAKLLRRGNLTDAQKEEYLAIIEEELKERGLVIPGEQKPVTKRVIHTTADFDYVKTMVYAPDAIETAKNLILQGADIVTDTNMALAGINKRALARHGGEAHCFMADEKVAALAKERGVTRATVSMEFAAQLNKPVIFAVGNAPTALIRLYEMITGGEFRPAFIIGVPVGFVNVEAAKELILKTDVPYIINRGRKGGSNVAAAICNALLYELGR